MEKDVERRGLTCIRCPRGCRLTVTLEGEEVLSVEGNACPRGDGYAGKEVSNPTRTVTTTVPVRGCAPRRMVSVKTAGDVPKSLVLDVVRELADVSVDAPVGIGDVILADVCGTGVDVVATRDVTSLGDCAAG